MTKQQQIETLKTENEQLRALLAQTLADHEAKVKALNSKLFAINSERAKWEARARAAQSTSVSAPRTAFAERAAAAREEATRSGRTTAIGSVA